MKKRLGTVLLQYWLPLVCGLTILCSLVYVAVQQDMRMGANDPQIQMAEDAVSLLQQGASPQTVLTLAPHRPGELWFDTAGYSIDQTLSPFLIIFDEQGKPLATTAYLHGEIPVPPPGVFSQAQGGQGEDRVTWQPEPGVRIAAVVAYYKGAPEIAEHNGGSRSGFVLAGRSLREVEKRESALNLQVTLAWIAAMIGTLVITTGIAFVINR